MVYNYQRTPRAQKYRDYSDDALNKAVEAVKIGLSHQKGAIKFGISRATINRAVNVKTTTSSLCFSPQTHTIYTVSGCCILQPLKNQMVPDFR